MIIVSQKLNFKNLVERAGFTSFRSLASELEKRGFRKLSDNTLSAWKHNKWRAKLHPTETLILCQALQCSLEELAEAMEIESDNENT